MTQDKRQIASDMVADLFGNVGFKVCEHCTEETAPWRYIRKDDSEPTQLLDTIMCALENRNRDTKGNPWLDYYWVEFFTEHIMLLKLAIDQEMKKV